MAENGVAEREIETEILSYLGSNFPALHNCTLDTPLIDSGALDSLGFLELMMFLSEKYGIELTDGDFDPSNLGTPGNIVEFVKRNIR
ncbi:Phosphopantetheine attachment site [Devosia crocina]|uniref:Phosphopantetheine attachment site n=1 Tax=Devosia crocina TaxID=429728 RepID=A0A1I7NRD8_9HYPH|nr:acyl carrier protein [Devosia crocina]SFV37236.1 Phosphopantetheine attachment site [Devosia crocina]